MKQLINIKDNKLYLYLTNGYKIVVRFQKEIYVSKDGEANIDFFDLMVLTDNDENVTKQFVADFNDSIIHDVLGYASLEDLGRAILWASKMKTEKKVSTIIYKEKKEEKPSVYPIYIDFTKKKDEKDQSE